MTDQHTDSAVIEMAPPNLEIEWWHVSKPQPYEKNPRKHSKQSIEKIAASIREYGWRQPIVVDKQGVICLGHGRLDAAKFLKEEMVPVHVARDLSPNQIKALRLMDNRVQEESEWDDALLDVEIQELGADEVDLDLTGFDDAEIAELHRKVHQVNRGMENLYGAKNTEAADALRAKWAAETGQLWEIPSALNPRIKHRLLVGDALVDFPRLLAGVKPDGICTDPPYDLPARSVCQILNNFGTIVIMLTGDSQAFECAGYWKFRMLLVWGHKGRLGQNINMPMHSHSLCPILTRFPDIPTNFKKPEPAFTTLFTIKEGGGYEQSEFGQAKSAAVFETMLSGFAWRTVADPFAGTGASLIACENQGRRWFGMEMDPTHAGVLLERAAKNGLNPQLVTEPAGEPQGIHVVEDAPQVDAEDGEKAEKAEEAPPAAAEGSPRYLPRRRPRKAA